MRHALSVLCLVLGGLLAAGALAGHQLDRLLHEPEPVRQIAGQLPGDPEFSRAAAEGVSEGLAEQLPEAVSGLIGSSLEEAISSAMSGLLDDEAGRTAWYETLDATRTDYARQLEEIFHEGADGDDGAPALSLDLTPVARELVRRIPLISESAAEEITPEAEVEIDPVADVDPYAAATLAQAASYWWIGALAAGVLAVLGLLLGSGRTRWVSLVLGGLTAAASSVLVLLTVASPEPGSTAQRSPAAQAVREHVLTEFGAWARPGWWLLLAAAGVVLVLGVVGLIAARGGRGGGHAEGAARGGEPVAESRPGPPPDHPDLDRV